MPSISGQNTLSCILIDPHNSARILLGSSIEVRYQATDLPVLSANAPGITFMSYPPASSHSSSNSLDIAGPTGAVSSNKRNLSTGAKVGIGFGVAIVALSFICLGAWLVFRKKRTMNGSAKSINTKERSDLTEGKPHLYPEYRVELENTMISVEPNAESAASVTLYPGYKPELEDTSHTVDNTAVHALEVQDGLANAADTGPSESSQIVSPLRQTETEPDLPQVSEDQGNVQPLTEGNSSHANLQVAISATEEGNPA
jgi:hypothetical protein